MTETTNEHVECPICGEGFDPTAAGGWCTNPECGEWQYLGDEVPDPAETAQDDASSIEEAPDHEPKADMDDDWIEAPTEPGSPLEASRGDGREETTAGASEDASTGGGESTDDELTLEFGTAPGDAGDESTTADESTGDTPAEPDSETVEDDGSGTEACPECGAEVASTDAFCAACGAELEESETESMGQSEARERLALTARGEEVLVSPDQTVGRRIRRIVTDTGGDEDDAVLIHREHVRFVREDGQFYVVDLGDNPTILNGSRLSKGDREPVGPGDELTLSDVVTLSIGRP